MGKEFERKNFPHPEFRGADDAHRHIRHIVEDMAGYGRSDGLIEKPLPMENPEVEIPENKNETEMTR